MPLIKVDYNEKLLGNDIDELIQDLLKESMRIYDYGEDKVSIFSASYGKHHFSTAAAEIEVRAKLAEYDKPGTDKNELRQKHMTEYQLFFDKFIATHKVPKGIVFTITFEDWQVVWIEGVS